MKQNKIDLRILLKHCEKGYPLYSIECGNCFLHKIELGFSYEPIWVTYFDEEGREHYRTYDEYGFCNFKQDLFPNRFQLDWNKFIAPDSKILDGSMVYYKHRKNDIEWNVGFFEQRGEVFIMNGFYKKFINAEIIIPIDKIIINNNKLSYNKCDNYGMDF